MTKENIFCLQICEMQKEVKSVRLLFLCVECGGTAGWGCAGHWWRGSAVEPERRLESTWTQCSQQVSSRKGSAELQCGPLRVSCYSEVLCSFCSSRIINDGCERIGDGKLHFYKKQFLNFVILLNVVLVWQSTKTSRKLRTFLFETFLITCFPCTIVNVFKGRVLQVERDGCPHVAFRRPCRPDSYFSRCHESILRVGLNRPRGAFRVVFTRCGSTLYIQNQRHIRHVEFKLFSNWVPAFNS